MNSRDNTIKYVFHKDGNTYAVYMNWYASTQSEDEHTARKRAGEETFYIGKVSEEFEKSNAKQEKKLHFYGVLSVLWFILLFGSCIWSLTSAMLSADSGALPLDAIIALIVACVTALIGIVAYFVLSHQYTTSVPFHRLFKKKNSSKFILQGYEWSEDFDARNFFKSAHDELQQYCDADVKANELKAELQKIDTTLKDLDSGFLKKELTEKRAKLAHEKTIAEEHSNHFLKVLTDNFKNAYNDAEQARAERIRAEKNKAAEKEALKILADKTNEAA